MTALKYQNPEDTPYEIYIMRHGIAEDLGVGDAMHDSDRKLTDEGKDKMRKIARGLKRLGVELDWIVSSPLRRARETAEIVSGVVGSKVPLDTCEALEPGESDDRLFAFLAVHPERRRMLLVGHEPDVSMLAARLMGAGRNVNLAFKKGACCLIVSEEFPGRSRGRLAWWLTPRQLCAIG